MNSIDVHVADGTVTLAGSVQTWSQREIAEKTAWLAVGVISVENRIKVEWYRFS